MPDTSFIADSISDLVSQFIDLALVPEADTRGSSTRQAGLMYELDSLISNFLDQNELSPDNFNDIEQQVLNTLAEDIIHDTKSEDDVKLNSDDQGNYEADAVLSALDFYSLDNAIGDSLGLSEVNTSEC